MRQMISQESAAVIHFSWPKPRGNTRLAEIDYFIVERGLRLSLLVVSRAMFHCGLYSIVFSLCSQSILPIAILLDYHQSVLAFGPKKKPRTLLFPTIELKLVACPLEQRGANCEKSTSIVGRADSLLHRLHAT